MLLSQEHPDFRYILRGVSADGSVLVNQATLSRSFLVSADTLVEHWRPTSVADFQPDDWQAVFELKPTLVLLGTGPRQQFPEPRLQAACLMQGIGLEVMDSSAAARTFNVLAGEGRKVVAAFLIPPR